MSNMQREGVDSEREVHVVLARVTALVPEFNMVDLLDEADRSYAVTARTTGVDWRALQLGQLLRCQVQGRLSPQVLSAAIVEPLILGLGFDGVLHPANSSTEPKFCRLPLLETWFARTPASTLSSPQAGGRSILRPRCGRTFPRTCSAACSDAPRT